MKTQIEKQRAHFIKWLKTWRNSEYSNARMFERNAGLPVGAIHKYTADENPAKPKTDTLLRCIAEAKKLGYKDFDTENQRVKKKKAK
jgi:hypothetical protein